MDIKNRSTASIGMLALTAAAASFTYASELNYTYVEVGYLDTEVDDSGIDIDIDGFGISGSVAIGDTFFVTAAYVDQDGDGSDRFLSDFDAEGEQFSVGLGAHWALSDSIDIVGTVSYIDVEAEIDVPGFGSVSADDDGFGLGIGLRGKAGDAIELEGGLQYVDLDDSGDDTAIFLEGRYYFSDNFAAGVGVSFSDDETSWEIGARYEF